MVARGLKLRRAALFVLVALPAAAPQATPAIPKLFDAPWTGFDTGSFGDGFGPRALAAGDLDGDGDADVVVGQHYFGSPGVSVLLGIGDGTFDRPKLYALPANDSVGRVALGDVDGDGDLDVLATVPDTWGSTRRVALWRNDGSGLLDVFETYPTWGEGAVGVALSDFDGDGHEDVATADFGSNGSGSTISLLRHDGNVGPAARFLPPLGFECGPAPLLVAAGDLDGDARPDLAVARADILGPTVSILLNDGDGGFLPPTDLRVEARGAPTVALGDLDRDGDLDVVTSWHDQAGIVSRGVVTVLRNDGRGRFGSRDDHPLDDFAEDPVDVALADLDGDGLLDVLTANSNGRSNEGWRVLLADGLGGFEPPSAHPSSQNTEAVLALDVDADGDRDVVSLAHFSAAITVHENPGTGRFARPEVHPVAGFSTGMDAADLDGDGDVDLAVTGAAVEIFRNEGDGSLGPAVAYPVTASVSDVKLRDLDGDGWPDLLLNAASAGGFTIGLNDGAGGFGEAVAWSVDPCSGGAIDAFDLDGDDDLDVVMAGCARGFDRYLVVARNDGSARFSLASIVPTLVGTRGIAAARMDLDATLDLVSIESGFGLSVFPGNGDLTFAEGVVSAGDPYLFALRDFDGDGLQDAGVVMSAGAFGTAQVGIARGQGDGTFGSPFLVTGSSVLENLRLAIDLEAADADCDGLDDLLVTHHASNDIGVFASNGDGTLRHQVRQGANLTPSASHVADFTGDGLLDIVTASQEVGPPAIGRSLIVLPGLCGVPPQGCGALPEVDRRSLRLRKLGILSPDLEISFDDSGVPAPADHVNVYRGTIAAFRTDRPHDHRAVPGGCELPASPFVDPGAGADGVPDHYYLAVHRCGRGADAREGSYGFGRQGPRQLERPDAAAASGETCP